nr:hypothetical protein [uncultured Peptostreptococcus sp.]
MGFTKENREELSKIIELVESNLDLVKSEENFENVLKILVEISDKTREFVLNEQSEFIFFS